MFCCRVFTTFCDGKEPLFDRWELFEGFCCKDPAATCCNELSELPCPDSKLEPGCIGIVMFCCAADPEKVGRELCCRLLILFCCTGATEPCMFAECSWGLI
ncbi:hypothetical protein IC575_000295 [Cucumis melo]